MFGTAELGHLDRQPAAFSLRTAAICVFCVCVCIMGAVLGFLRLLVPSWLAQNRTATRESRRRGSRRRIVTSISHSGSSSSDDCSFSSCYSRSQGIGPLVLAEIEVWVTVRF